MIDMGWLFYRVKVSGGLGAMIAVNLLHMQGFLPDYSLNDPSWSVSVELGAYLLFPVLIYVMFKAGELGHHSLHRARDRHPASVCRSFDPSGGMAYRWPPFDFARCVVEFGFGMLVYRAFASGSRLCVVGRDGWTWAIAGVAWPRSWDGAISSRSAVFPFLVLAFALNRGGPGRVLSHPWLHYLGVISFSIYLVHNMFRVPEVWLARILHPAPLPPWMALSFAVLGSVSILPVAALAYHGVERPGRDALNSIVRRLNRSVPVSRGAPGRRRLTLSRPGACGGAPPLV